MRVIKLVTGLGILALAAFLARGSVTPAHAVFNDSDGDGNIDLVEQITGSDPQNAASTPEDISIDLLFGGNSCNDAVDNNGDGQTDSAGPGCQDSDNDFISNAMETRLGSDLNDNTSFPESSQFDAMLSYFGVGFAITCGDAADNDHDGLTDGEDPGCVQIQNDGDDFSDAAEKLFGSDPTNPNSVPEHDIPNPGSCTDGSDNDLDGLTDSADPGCQPAPNDSFANATSISSLPYDDSEKISSATRSPTDPYSSCASPGMTVWYRYTAASDDVLVVSTAGSTFGANLSVWTTSGGRLSEVTCAGTYRTAGTVRAAFRATAGQTYYVLVGGDIGPGSPAMLGFHLSVGTPPSNDDFGNAETISALPFTTTVDTTSATTETGEPNCYYGRSISSVWYRFAPAQDTLVVADAGESSFFPILSIWTSGTFGLSLTACSESDGSESGSSRVAFLARAGQTYYVQAGGFYYGLTTSGSLHLSVQVGISPANDNFAGATNVSSLPFDDSVDTFTATTELSDPLASCTYGDYAARTIWYRYTATADGYVEADLGSDFNYALYITAYEGSSLDSLSEVACAANGANKIGFAASAGQTYYLLVGARSYRGGKFVSTSGPAGGDGPPSSTLVTFHMDTLTVPPCATPSFSFTDAAGDTNGGFGPPPPGTEPPDIVLVTGGNDSQNVCVRVEFAAPVPPVAAGFQQPYLNLNFDGSEFPGRDLTCPYSEASELEVYIPIPSNILVPLYVRFSGAMSTGYALFDDRSVTVIVPLSAIGGDDHYRVTAYTSNGFGSDCAPDVGAIQSPPAQPGDANCDGRTDSIDSVIILQLFANLVPFLPCQYAGDVNNNGGVGPIDALLILQYDSGMVTAFPSGVSSPGLE